MQIYITKSTTTNFPTFPKHFSCTIECKAPIKNNKLWGASGGEATRNQKKHRTSHFGQEKAIDLLLVSLLNQGHVLLESVPGTGKTMLAKTFAKSIDSDFKRIQFTPDVVVHLFWRKSFKLDKIYQHIL